MLARWNTCKQDTWRSSAQEAMWPVVVLCSLISYVWCRMKWSPGIWNLEKSYYNALLCTIILWEEHTCSWIELIYNVELSGSDVCNTPGCIADQTMRDVIPIAWTCLNHRECGVAIHCSEDITCLTGCLVISYNCWWPMGKFRAKSYTVVMKRPSLQHSNTKMVVRGRLENVNVISWIREHP